MQTILITGANGFVGYYLSQLLLQKGYRVIATGKGECRLPFKGENFIYQSFDFTSATEVQKIFEEYKPAIVVHCGAL
jgi:dTDP-4-dehydrorhamnose reductase